MSAGKGSSPRSCFSQEYRENFDAIFGKKFPQRRRGAEDDEKEQDPFAEISSEIRRIITEEPDDADRRQKLMGLSFAKAGRMIARQNAARTVPPYPLS